MDSLVLVTDFLHSATQGNQTEASAIHALQEADVFLLSQQRFWFSAQNLPSTSRFIAAIMFSLAHSVVRWYALRRLGDSPSARSQFLAAASDVADNISAAANAEILHLWFDLGVTIVSDIGLCLFKVRQRVCRLADDKAEGMPSSFSTSSEKIIGPSCRRCIDYSIHFGTQTSMRNYPSLRYPGSLDDS
jgi:hypothetical protein